MRLTEDQKQIIRNAGLRHFRVVPRLFGSRLDDHLHGGDIDLFIPGNWSADELVTRRLRFCAELRRELGDRKIDVVVGTSTPSAIQEHARQTGEPI